MTKSFKDFLDDQPRPYAEPDEPPMTDKLMPCPFCGGENIETFPCPTGYVTTCSDCNIDGAMELFGKTSEASISAWNTRDPSYTRTTHPALAAVREALYELITDADSMAWYLNTSGMDNAIEKARESLRQLESVLKEHDEKLGFSNALGKGE